MSADAAGLSAEIRRRLGPIADDRDRPLVSIVVLNRDGVEMLRRLLRGLVEHTDYPNLELILVDNASSDGSLEFMRRVEAPFPISILANSHNESFSDASNQGAELASGELLLFLNNDIEPFERGWLRELVACLRGSGAGAAAATLICLDDEHEASLPYGYGVQHRGLELREEDGMLFPVLRGWEADPLDEGLGFDQKAFAVAAACMLVEPGAFEEVDGFSHGYVYGAEDVDLCLKLHAAGRSVVCSGRSIAIHHPVSTRRAAPFEEERARKLANRLVLWERWGPRLRREHERDRAADGVYVPTICVKAGEPEVACGIESDIARLSSGGPRCVLLANDHAEDPIGLNHDIAVHCVGAGGIRYVPKPGQLNVLWFVGKIDHSPPSIERSRYDLAFGACESLETVVEASVRTMGEPLVEAGVVDRKPTSEGGW